MRVITPPQGTPIALAEFKSFVSVERDDLDGEIDDLLTAAVLVVETATRRPMLSRVVELAVPDGGWRDWWLPVAPVQAVLGADAGQLLTGFDEPRLRRGAGLGPSVQARVGYGTKEEIPASLRRIAMMLAKEWHDFGSALPAEGSAPPMISFGVQRLIRQMRYRRPCEVA